MPICARCHGTGVNKHSGFECDACAGSGFIDYMDVLTPWIVVLIGAGIAFTAGKWLWELWDLFHK